MKIVRNKKYGGFGLSVEALIRIAELKGFRKIKVYQGVGTFRRDITDSPEEWKKSALFVYVLAGDEEVYFGRDSYVSVKDRTDPVLIKVVTDLGQAASAQYASLEVVEIPDDVDWGIRDEDGAEVIFEEHREW